MYKDSNLLDKIPTRTPRAYRIRLNTSFRPLFIGRLDENGAGRFVTQKKVEKHFHRNSHGVALNAALLSNPEYRFKWIEVDLINEDGRIEKLVTSREYFLAFGKPFCYKGYEPQISLEHSLWGRDKVKRWERSRNSQTDLFAEVA